MKKRNGDKGYYIQVVSLFYSVKRQYNYRVAETTKWHNKSFINFMLYSVISNNHKQIDDSSVNPINGFLLN